MLKVSSICLIFLSTGPPTCLSVYLSTHILPYERWTANIFWAVITKPTKCVYIDSYIYLNQFHDGSDRLRLLDTRVVISELV